MKELGVLVPVVTPCSRAGDVDVDGLRAVCRDMLNAGAAAIFVAGSTGRGPWFNTQDRARLCSGAAEEIGPNVPLFAGCMAPGLSEMLEKARAMADAGAQVAVLTAPAYFNYSQQEVEVIFAKFADASPLPVVIYDIPVFTGMKLNVDMVCRLARHENVIGFKDSSADLERFLELLNALSAMDDFYLLQGKEHLLADSLLAGASGFVVSLLHVDPFPFVAMYRAGRTGDRELACRFQEKVTAVMQLMVASFERRPEISTLFHFLNHALRERGICENILLDHEGECPDWLAENAEKALEHCRAARTELGGGTL